jgi:LmbE family N-acetylglucosaminyl deacetylase
VTGHATTAAGTTLVLSPHLDDATLSVGGQLLTDHAEGRRTVVMSVFTSPGPTASAGHKALYARREQEEAAAAERLGYEPVLLDLIDAPFRSNTYETFSGIVYGFDPIDLATLERAEALVGKTLRAETPEVTLAPLGVGTHVDHRLLCVAAIRAFRKVALPAPAKLLLYEERPYALCPGATEQRLAALGAMAASKGSLTELRSFFGFARQLLSMPYVRSYLRGPLEHSRVMREAWRSLRSPPGPIESPLELTLGMRIFQLPTLDDVKEAASEYKSQIPPLFGDIATFGRDVLAASKRYGFEGRYTERVYEVG